MNGKRNPWEGVALIAFIDEEKMLTAIHKLAPNSTLSPNELQRNSFGKEYRIVFDENARDTVPSTMPGVLPPIKQCQTKMTVCSGGALACMWVARQRGAHIAHC